jgi:hypothetical protein
MLMMPSALLQRAAFPMLVLAAATLMVTSCTSDQPTEAPTAAPARPPVTFAEVGCAGCRRDNFTAPNGTLLENHVSDGDGAPFTWVKTFGAGAHTGTAEIQNNAVGKTSSGFWRYMTNALEADSIEIEIEVLEDFASVSQQYDIGIVLRNNNPGGGGFDGYTIFWSAYGDGRGGADAFITVDRPGSNILYEENVPVPTPGTHTLGAAVLESGAILVYVDGVLTATVVDPSPLPPGNAGLNFGWTSSPSGIVWITSFAEGLHQLDSTTVTLEKDDGQVWPTGVIGAQATQVQLRVRVDSSGTKLKNKWVKLSVVAVDSSGAGSDAQYGHFHSGTGGAPKPAGKLSLDSVSTGENRIGIVEYTSGLVSGPVVVRAEFPGGRPASVTIPVGVPELIALTPSNTFDLVGVKPIHPSSHWVTVGMASRLIQLAQIFYENHTKKLGYNDASLPFGGKFDLNRQWGDDDPTCKFTKDGVTKENPKGCHQTHRRGVDQDLNIGSLTKEERTRIRTRWAVIAKLSVINEGDHFHLAYRP